MKNLLTILLTLTALAANAKKDTLNAAPKNYVSVELDPAPFILGGYSFSLKFSPARLHHVSFMASVYSSKFPDKMMSKTNYENGFRNLKMKTSYAFFADYFIRDDRSGLHFGPSVFYYSKSVELNSGNEATDFKSIYPNIRAGYVYKPFRKSGFYVNPWLNVGKEFELGEDNTINGRKFSAGAVSYVLAIHLGYRVTF